MECWDIWGVCVEKRLQIGDLVLSILGLIGLLSLLLGYKQLKGSRKSHKIQTLVQLYNEFFDNESIRSFLYRLDYSNGPHAWVFDPNGFPHSEEEIYLDSLLYKFNFIGSLVSTGALSGSDLEWLRVEAEIVLENEQVLKYIEWIQEPDQMPGHSAFAGAAHLYIELFEKDNYSRQIFSRYLKNMRT